jgi:hypothetical protein
MQAPPEGWARGTYYQCSVPGVSAIPAYPPTDNPDHEYMLHVRLPEPPVDGTPPWRSLTYRGPYPKVLQDIDYQMSKFFELYTKKVLIRQEEWLVVCRVFERPEKAA